MKEKEYRFRFQDLEIWNRAAEISIPLLDLADDLDKMKKYKFAEQIRSAVLSITNNIAEGSGSTSNRDFRNFLKYARRSVFEVANILILITRASVLSYKSTTPYFKELVEISKMISGFMKTLKR